MTSNTTPAPVSPGQGEPQDLVTVPEHHNDLGDWCPSSGSLTADGTCPQYCRRADEQVGFDAGEREGDEDDPAEVSQEREDAAVARWEARQAAGAAAVRRCAYCGALGELEAINAGPSVACVNVALCELRRLGLDPVHHLTTIARAVGADVVNLGTLELARLVYVLKAAVVAAEGQLVHRPDRDAATEQAAGEMKPRH